MHEVSIASELLTTIERVARESGGRRVRAVDLVVGELAGVDADALSFAFEIVSRGTIAEGAVVTVDRAPLLGACGACGLEGPGDLEALACAGCGGSPVRVTGGRELRLTSIDIEDD